MEVATVKVVANDDGEPTLVVFVHVDSRSRVAARMAAMELTADMGISPELFVDAPTTFHPCLIDAVESHAGINTAAARRRLREALREHNAAHHGARR